MFFSKSRKSKYVSGQIGIKDEFGATANLTLPKYSKLSSALAGAGYSIGQQGTIIIKPDTPPVTFAIRVRRFDDVINTVRDMVEVLGGPGPAPGGGNLELPEYDGPPVAGGNSTEDLNELLQQAGWAAQY